MLKHRLLVSAILIPTVIGLFAVDHRYGVTFPILFIVSLLISGRCVWELVVLFRAARIQPNFWLCLFSVWFMLLASWQFVVPFREWFWGSLAFTQLIGIGWVRAFVISVVVLMMHAICRYPRQVETEAPAFGREITTIAAEILIVVYAGVLLVMATQLRMLTKPGPYGSPLPMAGYFALGALVIAAKTGDIGAYTFGRLIGGPKMTPKLSPGKTWAGGAGHLLASGLCSVVWLCWLGPSVSNQWSAWSILHATIFGVVVGFAGLMGDLFESLIKRDVGVKDAPALLPGFGGLLDLMDSLLLAGPVAGVMWHLLR